MIACETHVPGKGYTLLGMTNKFHKATDVHLQSTETKRVVLNSHIHQAPKKVKGNVTAHEITRPADALCDRREHPMFAERIVFTVEEHLRAQEQIERLAHDLWSAGGCRHGTALNDWLEAEREVLEQFIGAYARRHELRQASGPGASVSVARKKPETRILKLRRTVAARDLQSTSTLE